MSYYDDNETERELYLALSRLLSAVAGNVPRYWEIPDLFQAMQDAGDVLDVLEEPTVIQLWQHVTSGEVYAVKVGEATGGVRRAAGPLPYSGYYEVPLEEHLNWDEEGLAEDMNQERDSYRLKELTPAES